MKKIVGWALAFTLLLGTATFALAAGPSYDDVNNAVRSGHLQEAQSMMLTVIGEHPNSAKAHFVEAEVLERLGRRDESQRELSRAEQLDPGLHTIPLDTVQNLRARLAAPVTRGSGAVAEPAHNGVSWMPILLIGGALLILFFLIRARRQAVMVQPAPGMGYGGMPYGGSPYGGAPYGGAPVMGGGMGSGILGGLATGAAVGAGMVAGEALAGELMGHHDSGRVASSSWDDQPAVADTSDLGVGGSWDSGGVDLAGGGGGDDWS
jgi:hypothetical protein